MFKTLTILAVGVLMAKLSLAEVETTPKASVNAPHMTADIDLKKLDREKFDYQKQLEEQKLEVERLKAWLTGGSILLPLAFGMLTLGWQTRTANKLKDREVRDMFELKAAEILFEGDSTKATKNRAKALTVLFPGRFPENFGDAFEPTQFGGPRYEAKLEVFKAACAKVNTPEEVYLIWHKIFPGDNWIKPLVPQATWEKKEGTEVEV